MPQVPLLSNVFYEASITVILKTKTIEVQKNNPHEQKLKNPHQNISCSNPQYINRIIYYEQVVFIPGMQD